MGRIMHKFIIFVIACLFVTMGYAQDSSDNSTFPQTTWQSKDANDVVTIQNGAGLNIVILITVNKGTSSVNVKNCGTVTKIEAGSSAVCTTNDDSNPVALSSDNAAQPAGGTYQIKPR